MELIPANNTQIRAAQQAIVNGDIEQLSALLNEYPWLSTANIDNGDSKSTLLHSATDWPGNFPNVDQSIQILASAGANVNARMVGEAHNETPLLWAASSNDVAAINALVECGADLEMDGSVTDGGTALSAAVNFGNWDAAKRLVELGAKTKLFSAAALGLTEQVHKMLESTHSQAALNYSFWMACSQGETAIAQTLTENGADINWIPEWDSVSALDEAQNKKRDQTVDWLLQAGALTAAEILEE